MCCYTDGFFSPSRGASCHPCLKGTFGPDMENTRCHVCDTGTIADGNGNGHCTSCGSGHFETGVRTTCSVCAPGSACDAGDGGGGELVGF